MGIKTKCNEAKVAVLLACLLVISMFQHASMADTVDVIEIPAGTVDYQIAGEFLKNGLPVDPSSTTVKVEGGWAIMVRQVSQAEYSLCVKEGGCRQLDKAFRKNNDNNLPAVGVSWNDATDYAAWLSERTGFKWQLPDYELWVQAAYDRYKKEESLPADADNPAVRWLAEYERETARSRGRVKPAQPFGTFGENKLGLLDISGNVWEWTNTCFASYTVEPLPIKNKENCNVRILAGSHVAAIPDFIRDPKNGACSIGLPPANLGFRLVRKL